MATITPNKALTEPAFNDTGWDVTLNADFSLIDASLGATQTINTTGLSGNVTLVATYPAASPPFSYIPQSIILTNTPSANVTFIIPSRVGGSWTVYNSLSASTYSTTFASGGGGTSVVIPYGQSLQIWSDGTNIRQSNSSISFPLYPTSLTFGPQTSVASAATVDLGAQTNRNILLTGTTTVSSFGSTPATDYIPYVIQAQSAITLTNSASLVCPGGIDLTLIANDIVEFVEYTTGIWTCVRELRAGIPVGLAAAGITFHKLTNNAATPNTKIDWTFSTVTLVNSSGQGVFFKTGSPITCNLATTGAGGLDTGTIALNTWYYLYGISNGTALNIIASTTRPDAGGPSLPATYTYVTYLGSMRTGAATTLLRTIQYGSRTQYQVTASSTTPNIPIIISGTTGTYAIANTMVLASVSISGFVPTTATNIRFVGMNYWQGGSSVSIAVGPNTSFKGPQSTTNPVPYNLDSSAIVYSPSEFILESSNIGVAISNTNGAVGCLGWTDRVNAT